MKQITRRGSLALGLFGAATLALPSVLRAAPATKLRVGWQKGGVLGLVKAEGAFEKAFADQGIRVEWAEFTSGPPMLEALSANALDFGYTGDVPPIFAHAARGNLLFVGATESSDEGHAILVPADSPLQTVEELKGKRIAFKRGSSAHGVLIKFLRNAGVKLDDITQLDLSPPDAIAAFDSGDIDAWVIWDPYLALAEARPNTRVLITSEGLNSKFGFYSANGDYTRDNPELIPLIVEEIRKVGVAGQENLDRTIQIFATETGLSTEVIRTYLTRKGADLGKHGFIQESHIEYEQALADDFLEIGVIPAKLDIRSVAWTPGQTS